MWFRVFLISFWKKKVSALYRHRVRIYTSVSDCLLVLRGWIFLLPLHYNYYVPQSLLDDLNL